MNLFKPYQVLSEIYKVGAANHHGAEEWKKSSSSGMLLAWWVFWIGAHIVIWGIGKQTLKHSFRDDLSINQIIDMYYGSVTVCVISFIVACLWFTVAENLTRRLISGSTPKVVSAAFSSAPVGHESVVPVVANLAEPAPQENGNLVSLKTVFDEDHVYAEIAQELETGVADKGLWIRLFAESGGDDKQTKVLYIKQRAERLIAAERLRLAQVEISQEQADETRRLEEVQLQSSLQKENLVPETDALKSSGLVLSRSEFGAGNVLMAVVLALVVYAVFEKLNSPSVSIERGSSWRSSVDELQRGIRGGSISVSGMNVEIISNSFDVYDKPWGRYLDELPKSMVDVVEAKNIWWTQKNKFYIRLYNPGSKDVLGFVFSMKSSCLERDKGGGVILLGFDLNKNPLKSGSYSIYAAELPFSFSDTFGVGDKCGVVTAVLSKK